MRRERTSELAESLTGWSRNSIISIAMKKSEIFDILVNKVCDVCEEIRDVRSINCSPIPLTNEILEKNGFYDRNTQWYYKRFGSYVCFDIAISLIYRDIEVSKVCGAGTDCEEEEYGSSIVFGNDICVHNLQHVLRLCGLDELADNFKV